MKKFKFFSAIVMLVTLLIGQTLSAWADEREWYELQEVEENISEDDSIVIDIEDGVEISPYTRYILGAKAILKEPSSGVLWMRSEVYCTETMSKITTTFTLQKKSGNSWIDVGKGSVSVTNDNSMYKSMQATGVSSGTYRCVANTRVVSKSGYSETLSVISNTV